MYSTTFTRTCGCCGATFTAKHPAARWCSSRCGMRAYQRRRRGAPEADPGVTRTLRTAAVQSEILDDPDDLPLAWRTPALEPAPLASAAPFAYGGHQVRVITDEQGEPWFVAADVCAVLGISSKQTRRLDDDEKGVRSMHTLGGTQSMTTVNEFGLYSLILGSRKPEARAFKRWVTHEVLPSIRKTGSYGIPDITVHSVVPVTTLPKGVHVIASTRREAAQLWWDAISGEVMGALARRLDPATKTDSGLPMQVRYSWQPSLF